MVTRGGQLVDSSRDKLACPTCGYSFRGLVGAVITCPECGQRVDVATLVTQLWTKPWYRAPGFNLLLFPTVVIVIGAIASFVAWASWDSGGGARELPGLMAAGTGVVWMASIAIACARFRTMRATAYALLAHAAFVVYVAAVVGGLLSAARLVVAIGSGSGSFVVWLAPLAFCAGLLYVGRRLERAIAAYCIREYLAATVAPA